MKTKIILTTAILFITLTALATPPSEEGKTIFSARCAACHNVNKMVVGPALAGIDQRRPIDWIVKFVHSSQTVVKSGDPYAVDLFNKFNKIAMPDHPDLTEGNIKSIVEYIKTEAKAATETKPEVKAKQPKTDYLALVLNNKAMLFCSLALLAVLIISLVLIVRVKQIRNSKTSK
jgi:cytochrome c551/c552